MWLDSLGEHWEILLVALFLGAGHVFAPRAFENRKHPEQWRAFGGGLSAAYVFLHLIPALDASQGLLGQRIYFIALLGFLAFYALELRFQPPRHNQPTKYHVYLGALFVYNGLLIFTLGHNLPSTPILTLVFGLSLALESLETDLQLQETFGLRFAKSGRWVLLTGVATGFGLNLFRRPHPEVIDIVTAALTGFMIFQTFVGIFPVSRTRRFSAFVAGVITFLGLHVLLGGAA